MGTILLSTYVAVLACLAVFGVHRLALLLALHRCVETEAKPGGSPRDGGWPAVTVQLPVFNERFVVSRLIRAACRLDYPGDRLEVQVLDDSTDETRAIAGNLVAGYRAAGVNVVHLHRTRRDGFKAGALAAGTARARGEFLAVFDADFVPEPDFLRLTLAPFCDPAIGMVQARWGHLNRNHSALTRLQAILLDGHFSIDHAARQSANLFFNFNGTAGVWRRRCIEDAGGWQGDTLTEDLDLSYRAQLAGWRFVYLDGVVAPAELPGSVEAFKTQQHRWAKGSIQTARKLLPALLRAPLPLRRKLAALFHLGENAAYLLLLLLSVLLVASLPARSTAGWPVPAVEVPLFVLGTLSVCAYYLRSQKVAGAGAWRRWLNLPGVMALGIGLAVNNGRAVLEGLAGRRGEFRRTPKQGARGRRQHGYHPPGDPFAVVEGLLALGFAVAMIWAAALGALSALPFLALFGTGFGILTGYQGAGYLRRRLAARRTASHRRS